MIASTKSITSGEVYNKNRTTLITDTEVILWMFVEGSFHLTVESNQWLLWFCISALRDWLKQLTPLCHPIRKSYNKARFARKYFPALRIRYTTAWSFDWFTGLCVSSMMARVITLALVSRYSLVTNGSFTYISVLHEKDKYWVTFTNSWDNFKKLRSRSERFALNSVTSRSANERRSFRQACAVRNINKDLRNEIENPL